MAEKNHKKKFTPDEDALLREIIIENGETDWEYIADLLPHRTIRQCRDRWNSYLKPSIKSTPWTDEEEAKLLQKFETIGPRWVKMSRQFPGRSDVALKNRYLVIQRRKRHDIITESKQIPVPETPPALKKELDEIFASTAQILNNLDLSSADSINNLSGWL